MERRSADLLMIRMELLRIANALEAIAKVWRAAPVVIGGVGRGGARVGAGRPRTIPHVEGWKGCICWECRRRPELEKPAKASPLFE